jgi:hypothetical protein
VKSRLRKNNSKLKKNKKVALEITGPVGLIFPDFQDKVDNKDEIKDRTYGPSFEHEWSFEDPIKDPEWNMIEQYYGE